MRTSSEQYLILIEFMEKNGDLAKPSTAPRGRNYVALKWAQLTMLLNAEGTGASRSEDKWRKVWSDYKNNIKKKLAKINKSIQKTGGGPATNYLTNVEARVVNIVGFQAATGMENINFTGIKKQTETTAQTLTQNSQLDLDQSQSQPQFTVDLDVEPLSEQVPEILIEEVNNMDSNAEHEEPRWNPPPAKRTRGNTDASNIFLECERQNRKDAKDRDRMYERLENERIRQRDEELRLRELEINERVQRLEDQLLMQGRWMDFMAECLNVFREYMSKKD